MQHFFVTPPQVKGETVCIEGSDVNHMKQVLRMRPGEHVMVSDGNNRRYECEICGYEEISTPKAGVSKHDAPRADAPKAAGAAKADAPRAEAPTASALAANAAKVGAAASGARFRAVLRVLEEKPADTELKSRIYLFQGLPKQEKMELIVQKCVELGIYEIVPVAMHRCVVRLDAKKAEKKRERWQQIAESAAKQAGRGIIPRVSEVLGYREALKKAGELDVLLIPYELADNMEETRRLLAAIKPGQSIGIFIGPEGGFEKEEVELARESGAREITLGKRILRTETAGLALLSVLMFHLED